VVIVTPAAGEPAHAEAELDGVDSGIGRGQPGIGNMQVAKFDAPVEPVLEDVDSERPAGREIHSGSSAGHLVVGEEDPATEFEVGHNTTAGFKVPFQRHGIEAQPIGGVGGLEDQEDGNHIHRIFKAAAQEAGAVRLGQDPAVARPDVPHSGVRGTSVGAVPAASPKLNLVPTLFRLSLRAGNWGREQHGQQER